MDWLNDHLWAGWLTLAVALGVLELVSLDLFLIMLAGGAVVGALVALLGGPLALQIVLALISAVGLLGVIRPNVVRRLHSGPTLRTGADALIGKRATVLRELGETVDVVQIKGATAYVLRVHRLGS